MLLTGAVIQHEQRPLMYYGRSTATAADFDPGSTASVWFEPARNTPTTYTPAIQPNVHRADKTGHVPPLASSLFVPRIIGKPLRPVKQYSVRRCPKARIRNQKWQ